MICNDDCNSGIIKLNSSCRNYNLHNNLEKKGKEKL